MSEQRMDIFLLAAPQAGIEHAVLVSNLSAAFKKDPAAIEKMLSRPRTMVKADVTPEIAGKYKVLIEKSGGQCELVVRASSAVGEAPAAASSTPVQAEAPVAPVQPAAVAAAPATIETIPPVAPLASASAAPLSNSAPIPAVTPVPEVPPELIAVQPLSPDQAAASSEEPGPVSPQADPAPVAAFEQDVVAQLQAWAGNSDEQPSGEQQGTDTSGEEGQDSAPVDNSLADTSVADHSDAACYCAKCGTVIRLGQNKCSKCFSPVIEHQAKHKTTAALLAFFAGGLGLHRLYLGQWWGVIYMLFLWTLIPILVAVVESVVFFLAPQKKWDAHYGRVQKSSPLLAAIYAIAFFVLVGLVALLSALVIPVHQDYTNRAKVQSASPQVHESLDKVADFIKKNQTYPGDNHTAGLPEKSDAPFIESINLQDGAIVQVVYRLSGATENNIILWIPTENQGEIIWDCKRGTLPDKYRPRECRSGDVPINRELERAAAESALSQKLYSADKHISLLVPITWEVKELLPAATIGAARLMDENYVVVLADAKANFEENLTLADYSRNVQLQLADNIKSGMVQGDVEYLTIAGFPAEQFVFPGVVGGVKIAYVVTLINGDTHFYRVLAWTLQTRMEQHKKLLKSISESVKIY